MLIIKKREKAEPATFTHLFRGEEITLTVRPFDADEVQKILKKHTRYVMAVHPETKQAVRIPESNNKAIGEDVIDYLLVDFSGIGSSQDQPLEVTRENKLIVAGLKEDGPDGPVFLSEVIQKKAQELSEAVEVEAKEDAKN